MNRKYYYRIVAIGGSAVLSALFLVGGYVLGERFPHFDPIPLWIILCVAFACACVGNRFAAKAFARNHFGLTPTERQELLDRHEDECRRDPEAVLRKYADMETVPIFLLSLYVLLAVCIGVVGGICVAEYAWLAIPEFLLCGYLLYMPIIRALEIIPAKLNTETLVPVTSLPILHTMARNAARTVGIKGPIRLEITRDCECDANRIGHTYVVFFGTRLLSVLTEEEMEQALIMAFSALAQPKLNRQVLRKYRLGLLGSADVRRETGLFDLFFSYADAYMEWEYDLYTSAVRRCMKRFGYEHVRRVGNLEAAVNTLAKEAVWRYFVFECLDFVSTPFYEAETPHHHYERDVCQGFRTACRIRYADWMNMLEHELSPSGTKSPLFREEREILDPYGRVGLPQECHFLDADTPYGREVAQAIGEIMEERIYADIAVGYKEAREREYLEPLRIVEAYEACPDGYATPELSPVINAYRDLCRCRDAEALCDAILARETNQFALAHATYFKGTCMLHRYETEGIDLIYRAIDLNKNYMKDGFELVENYLTLCGLSDEYASFLRRAEIQMSAHAYNHEGAGHLAFTDRLEREEGLGDMLPDILSYIEQVSDGCISQVYLVRKVISEDFFTSAFVINFAYGIPDEQMRKTYSAIFNYLDAYPVDWQFSLFLYDRDTERAVKRVEGSLVWEKK